MKLLIFFFSLLALIQPLSAFCLENKLSDSTYFIAQQTSKDRPLNQSFSIKLNHNDRQCCHFSNTYCSPNGTETDIAHFTLTFLKDSIDATVNFHVACTSGGDLTVYNKGKELHATCKRSDGITMVVPLTAVL